MPLNLKVKAHQGFRLVSLELVENKYLGTIKFNFLDHEDSRNGLYTTVVIGPNGTGKSNLLRVIIELFKELFDLSKGGNRSYNVDGQFALAFSIAGSSYKYTNMEKDHSTESKEGTQAHLFQNDQKVEFTQVDLPQVIVANSIMLTDKYLVLPREDAFPIYKYLGVRNTPQGASTRIYVRKTVEFIAKQVNSIPFREGLKNVAEFLGLENKLEIVYLTSNTRLFFKGELTPQVLKKYFLDMKKKYDESSSTPPFKVTSYISLANDPKRIQRVCDFANRMFREGRLIDIARSSIKKIQFDIVDDHSFQQLKKDFSYLENLRLLGMLYPPEIRLQRGSVYDLKESSSGEYHFFSAIVGLMATVKPNSLVFIDEPEVSLHPNWQMRYLSFMRQLFSGPAFTPCHMIVATHSHFLVSDMRAENSKLIGLRRERNIEIVELPHNLDTYGWSAEEVLYTVFKLRSVRNYFLGQDLTKLLGMIGQGSVEKDEIGRLVEQIEQLHLSGDDPLREIVVEARDYLSRI